MCYVLQIHLVFRKKLNLNVQTGSALFKHSRIRNLAEDTDLESLVLSPFMVSPILVVG